MRLPKIVVICALLSAGIVQGQTKWIYLRNDNFQIYSGTGEREARQTLTNFERVRNFFLEFSGRAPANPLPVYVVMFRNDKEYIPYRPNEFADAFYSGGTDRDYIVMSKIEGEGARVATHEYVHLVVRHADLDVPPWLGEGIAELFSTLKSAGRDKVEFGDVIVGHLLNIRQEKWIPLPQLLAADRSSPYYNEANKAGMFYSESWALVLMLATSPNYRAFWDMVSEINRGTAAAQAIEKFLGKPLAKVEEDLQYYVRGNQFRKLVMPAKIDTTSERVPVAPADMFDVKLALADLNNRTGHESETRQKLDELTREDPKRPEPWSGLAYLAWRGRDPEKAVEHFGKAFELGERSPKMLRDYGILAMLNKPAESIRALAALVELQPNNVEVRLNLAGAHYNQRDWVNVVETLMVVKSVTPDQAPRLFMMLANAQLQLGGRQEARASANQLLKYAKTDVQRQQANSMLDYLNRLDERDAALAARSQQAPPAAGPPSPALISRREPAVPGEPNRIIEVPTPDGVLRVRSSEPLETASGIFVEFLCSGATPSLVLETSEGRKVFALTEPDRTVITGHDGAAEFQCGAQKERLTLRIQYAQPPSGMNAAGAVRAIHFGQ